MAREVCRANCNDDTRYCATSSLTQQRLSRVGTRIEDFTFTVCCHSVLTDTQRRGGGAGGMEVRAMRVGDEG